MPESNQYQHKHQQDIFGLIAGPVPCVLLLLQEMPQEARRVAAVSLVMMLGCWGCLTPIDLPSDLPQLEAKMASMQYEMQALAASLAFMLSVQPPDAIVNTNGRVSLPQMAQVGCWPNLSSILSILLFVDLLLPRLLGITPAVLPAGLQSATSPATP